MTVSYPLTSCEKCPNMESKRHYTADSWEHVMKWSCKAAEDRHISYQETFDKTPKIPQWCPLRESDGETEEQEA